MLFQLCQVRCPGIPPLVAREGWGAPVAIPAATCSRATRALARAPYLVRIRAQSGDALSLRRHHTCALAGRGRARHDAQCRTLLLARETPARGAGGRLVRQRRRAAGRGYECCRPDGRLTRTPTSPGLMTRCAT